MIILNEAKLARFEVARVDATPYSLAILRLLEEYEDTGAEQGEFLLGTTTI
jgi:hypothetical protein